ncbi:unnamed protein product [Acanthoscelides obtectus]|uniref:EGF-like domain-containing protein n=1 Tax=Acanthoscelides obtectus TaxID=200917 RepID=A0A9P0LTJ3_ACAOB|nr:unnamed protein product [Acanthoscelides obtectus]CAK1620318.1 Adhesion G protein-coupled receptor L4 [Acanthoscelides obtectus]
MHQQQRMPDHLACINQKCKDPCPGICGQNAECRVVSHTPNCVCQPGYFGDPFTLCSIQQAVQEVLNPCQPSPCGVNAVCKERNGAGSCICLPEYIGNPYEGCRPECSVNSDCSSNKACVRTNAWILVLELADRTQTAKLSIIYVLHVYTRIYWGPIQVLFP